MNPVKFRPFRCSLILSGLLAGCLLYTAPVLAQGADRSADSGSSYRTGETTPVFGDEQNTRDAHADAASKQAAPTDQKAQGPVRLARFASIQGNVTWRADDTTDWSPATVNLPIREKAQIWVAQGGRADLQFDDGSELRLGNGAVAVLELLYSDAQGEFTKITLTDGLATLHARHDNSVYQIDTPIVAVTTKGPSQIRFGVDSGVETAVQQGSATAEGMQGKATLQAGDYLDLASIDTPYEVHSIPPMDSWDRWNEAQNRLIEGPSETYRHVPPDIGLVSGDLDAYGSWYDDPRYGWVWHPHYADAGWRPYSLGHWTWVEPFGWTWVSSEPWGWAPYHYGTWIDEPYGWAWRPGPAVQYWSPAVVSFSVYGGNIGWAPLCPWEVHYPAAFGLGFAGGNWAFSFSIGCAGVYYPQFGGYCVGRPFDNFHVNHFGRFDHEHFDHDRLFLAHNGWGGDHRFVPFNATHAAGATVAGMTAFGGRGGYQPLARSQAAIFTQGRSPAFAAGRTPMSGPPSVQPTRLAMTPTRAFTSNIHPPQTALRRTAYNAPLPASVRRNLSASELRGLNTASRSQGRFGAATPSRLPENTISRARADLQRRSAFNPGSSRMAENRNLGVSRMTESRNLGAAEAARQARSSLGMLGGGRNGGSPRYNGGYQGNPYGGMTRTPGSYRGSYSGLPRNGVQYGGRYSSPSPYGGRTAVPGGAPYSNRGMYGPFRSYRPGLIGGGYSGGRIGGYSGGGRIGGYSGGGRSGGYSGGGGGRSGGGGRRSGR